MTGTKALPASRRTHTGNPPVMPSQRSAYRKTGRHKKREKPELNPVNTNLTRADNKNGHGHKIAKNRTYTVNTLKTRKLNHTNMTTPKPSYCETGLSASP